MDLTNLKNPNNDLSLYKKSENIKALNDNKITNKSLGRPKKDEKKKLLAKIHINLTLDEKKKLEELANDEALSVSNLIRKYLRESNKI